MRDKLFFGVGGWGIFPNEGECFLLNERSGKFFLMNRRGDFSKVPQHEIFDPFFCHFSIHLVRIFSEDRILLKIRF